MALKSCDEILAILVDKRKIDDIDLSDFEFDDLECETKYNFLNCKVRKKRIKGDTLAGSIWNKCDFVECEFVSCDLSEAKFQNCTFFNEHGPSGCVFRFSDLKDAQFKECDLSIVHLYSCDAYGIDFIDCRMQGIHFEKTSFGKKLGKIQRNAASFQNCRMNDSILSHLNLSNTTFKKCALRNAEFLSASLICIELIDCDLHGADFSESDIAGADMRMSILSGLDLTKVRGYQGLHISAGQQHILLNSIGVDVSPDED